MLSVLIAPGYIGDFDNKTGYAPREVGHMRSLLYDTFSDHYNEMVVDEIFPKVDRVYRLRNDGYSRAIGGQSSGGICSLNAAWFRPHAFSRVLSRIGSYASIQWRYGQDNPFGGYPLGRFGDRDPAEMLETAATSGRFLIRKRDRKNIRIWLEDGAHDLENAHGSWPLQSIQLANSLKMKEYDFRFSFGNAQHNTAYGNAELPQAMTWLWRDYDPLRTHQAYMMAPTEKGKPVFSGCNRQPLRVRARVNDPNRPWLVSPWFGDHVLSLGVHVAAEWSRFVALVNWSVPALDALLAAPAWCHRHSVVTRNVTDLAGRGPDSPRLQIGRQRERGWSRGGCPNAFNARGHRTSARWRLNFVRTDLERDISQFGVRVPAATLLRF